METIKFAERKTLDALHEMVPNGPDCSIEAVGFHYAHSLTHKARDAGRRTRLHSKSSMLKHVCMLLQGSGPPCATVMCSTICPAVASPVLQIHIDVMLRLLVPSLQVEMKVMMETDPSEIINEIIYATRKGGYIGVSEHSSSPLTAPETFPLLECSVTQRSSGIECCRSGADRQQSAC